MIFLTLLSFVSPQVCTKLFLFVCLFHFLPFISSRTQLQPLAMKLEMVFFRIQRLLRVNVTKNQRNRGHSSKFNFAHTLSIGRPKSHTYDKDVRLLKFSLVWEKLT